MTAPETPYLFSVEAQRAVERARTIAAGAGSQFVDPIHLLCALLESEEVTRVLSAADATRLLRNALDRTGQRAQSSGAALTPYSSRAKLTFVYALDDARDLGHPQVTAMHLFLGLTHPPQPRLFGLLKPRPDPAHEVIQSAGFDHSILRALIARAA